MPRARVVVVCGYSGGFQLPPAAISRLAWGVKRRRPDKVGIDSAGETDEAILPFTHNLADLTELCAGIDALFRTLTPMASELTPYGVRLRIAAS